ncbi:Asp-tRNA(Asn)/Glu-tRNA(Gln) amidotransferase GatCAB subunit B, partial [Candidatus Hydrogenedentota bacterium]
RQMEMLEDGEKIAMETRLWDDANNATRVMRTKEQAHDYRYFPEPDLLPIVMSDEWLDEIRAALPELRPAKLKRFIDQYGIPEYDAGVLTASKATADYFETCAAKVKDAKTVSNWIMGDLSRLLNDAGIAIDECKIAPEMLAEMIGLIEKNTISGKIAKQIFPEMFETGTSPTKIVEEKGLSQISDTSAIEEIVVKVIEDNPGPADDVRNGKDKAIGFLVGQVMKASRGKANPQLVNEIMRKKLNE